MIFSTPVGAVRVYANDRLCLSKVWKQIRFPRSKKRRIRKKWSKRQSNFGVVVVHTSYKYKDELIVSSEVLEMLMSEKKSHKVYIAKNIVDLMQLLNDLELERIKPDMYRECGFSPMLIGYAAHVTKSFNITAEAILS